MGFELAALAIAAIGTGVAIDSQQDAKDAARDAAKERKKAQAEQQAMNAQKAAEERRQQVREERVRRAKILQSSENSGTSGSSGMIGAIGGLSTQLASNIGSNQGSLMHSQAIGNFSQVAADFDTKSQEALLSAQQATTFANFSSSIFTAAGRKK